MQLQTNNTDPQNIEDLHFPDIEQSRSQTVNIFQSSSIILSFPFKNASNTPKIDSGWGFAPYPTGGAYSAPPGPLAEFIWDG